MIGKYSVNTYRSTNDGSENTITYQGYPTIKGRVYRIFTFVSSLNPADFKILLAAKTLKQGSNPLSLLRVHEAIGYLRDKIVKPETIQNIKLFKQVLSELHLNHFLDFKALSYLKLLKRKGSFAVSW